MSAAVTSHLSYRFVKRAMDLAGAAILLLLLLPLLVMVASAVKAGSPRDHFLYRWRVVGLGGRPFTGYKFRSMVANAEELEFALLPLNEMKGPAFKLTNDPRITPVGRFLRKFSLDELPQLWSVIKGDMSLVGPHPPLQTEWDLFEPWHRRKLTVKPGITCLWQVKGRGRIQDFDDWARLDLEYVDNWSLWLDLKILLLTVPAVVGGTGK